MPDDPEPAEDEEPDRCVECGKPIGEDGRYYSDGVGELMPFCAECTEREFGYPAAARLQLTCATPRATGRQKGGGVGIVAAEAYPQRMRRLRLAVLLLVALAALLIFPLGSSGRPSAVNTWAGTWNSDFGKLTLSAAGGGNYEGFNPGSVSGTVNGNVLQGTWNQPGNPSRQGTFKFTMSADGRSFSGVWAYDSGGCGTACGWSGTCVAGPCLRNGAATKPKPKPKGCPVPPRLPASVRAETCRYKVIFQFEQQRVIPGVSEITSAGVGDFLVHLPAKAAGGCGESSFGGRHLHEDLTEDVLIVLEHTLDSDACLRIERRGGKVITLVVTLRATVVRSSDSDCPQGEHGKVVVRAVTGKQLPNVSLDICNHRHSYSPRGLEKRPTVTTQIVVKPA